MSPLSTLPGLHAHQTSLLPLVKISNKPMTVHYNLFFLLSVMLIVLYKSAGPSHAIDYGSSRMISYATKLLL